MLASIPQNQYPFAIGVMETSSADIAKNGLKGKGLKLLHHYPDMLWALGDKSVPDSSFTPTRIFPQVLSRRFCALWPCVAHTAHPHKLHIARRPRLVTPCSKTQPLSQMPT